MTERADCDTGTEIEVAFSRFIPQATTLTTCRGKLKSPVCWKDMLLECFGGAHGKARILAPFPEMAKRELLAKRLLCGPEGVFPGLGGHRPDDRSGGREIFASAVSIRVAAAAPIGQDGLPAGIRGKPQPSKNGG